MDRRKPTSPQHHDPGRRAFLKSAALTGAALAGSPLLHAAEPPMVPRKTLGRTGVQVPILNMGTSQTLDQQYDKRLHRALADGVDYIDTALSYGGGRSHAAVATFIEQVADRKKLWITSKGYTYDAAKMAGDVDEALSELRTDYLDLFFMHGVRNEKNLDKEFLSAGEALRKSGKVRFFGFSCHDGNVVELLNKAARVGGIDAIMFRYHFGWYGDGALNKAIDACKAAGIGLIAMKVQRSVPRDSEQVQQFSSGSFTLPQAKLKAVWADERIDSICSEMSSIQQVRENVAAARSTQQLSAAEQAQLQKLAQRTAHLYCNGCTHLCEPVLGNRVAVADMLRTLMYHESYGDSARARRLFRAIPPEQRHLAGEDLAAASAVCPQGIDLHARLHLAQRELA